MLRLGYWGTLGGCSYVEASTDPKIRRCPTDKSLLCVTSLVRPLRFHDLRHTTGSLLTMRGANTAFVQRIMRHSDPRMTTGTYCHLEPTYLKSGIDELLRFGTPPPAHPSSSPTAPTKAERGFGSASPTGNVPPVFRRAADPGSDARGPITKPLTDPASSDGAGYRSRTDDIQLGKLTLYQLS